MPENTQQDHQQPEHAPASDEMLARRRLLKLASYVPPAILGMMIVGGMPTPAVAGSCCPSACTPCGNINPNSRRCKHHWHECKHARHKWGKKHHTHCPPLPDPCRHHHGGGMGGGDDGGGMGDM